MINSEVFIIKRDGKKETFSLDKIKNAIAKAFLSVGSFATQDVITTVLSRVSVSDGMNVEEIQNQVEVALMAEHYYSVAKAYMLYRQKHLEDREVRDKLKFLLDYCDASNPATGSKYDANANVENKNIATLIGELPKSNFIRLNRRLLTDRLKDMYGKELSDRYLELLNHHFIYKNDETNLANYCASITMYPWLNNGTIAVGGNSTAPTNLKSFCGGFVNMVFIVSSMLSGACATPEFLMYMNYFIGLEYGQEYYKYPDKIVDLSTKQRTIDKIITDCFEQIVYSINQPTGARNFQAVFWNVAYYDKYYFESLFGNFFFPDGSQPDWNSLSWLQKRFMKWFNKERTRTVLTFPVETMALLTKDGDVLDKEYGDFTAEMYSEGHSFFTYMSDNADSLSSCCRLRNEIQDNGFSYTLGAGGVSTGSKSVLTINLNRCIQHAVKSGILYPFFLEEVVDLVHKVQLAYNENLKLLQIDAILARYQGKKGSLIPILQEVQALYNYLPKDALEYIAASTGTPIAQIYGVVTFYSQFHLNPRGRNIIRVCQGTACHVRGGKVILQTIEKELGIKAGHTTEDLRFTLETVACIGACGLAPVMQVNEDTHGRLTPDKLSAILAKYQ